MRAVFHEQGDAEVVVAHLRANGFEAMVARDRFAGEDDDESHAWAVLTDAPASMLEVLTDERDGWVDHDDSVQVTARPLELPTAPQRVKRQFRD